MTQTPTKDAPRCSDGARDRGDPLVGTAPPARRWLLIELEGRWLPTAIDSLGLRPEHRLHLAAAAAKAQARVMLIRRVGRRPTGPAPAWCVVDDASTAAGPITTWGAWSSGEDLVAAADLLASQAAEVGPSEPAPRDPDAPAPSTPELLLVCTHGRHDVCCAVRGLSLIHI